ncbi:MAG: hypothetical protein JRJ29_20120 [Deltaproteobacteria bacterium]|nr:hypothetical protein [Deltaproteobacteria bacterium]
MTKRRKNYAPGVKGIILEKQQQIIDTVRQVLADDSRVEFAYLYGSYAGGEDARDIDIAVYAGHGVMPHRLAVDLKIELSRRTGIPPDGFDIRVLNEAPRSGDLFGLLYLKRVLTSGILLLDRRPEIRTDFIEKYGMKYRECEGLIAEVLT